METTTISERLTQIKQDIEATYNAGKDILPGEEFRIGGLLNDAFILLDKGKFGKWVRDNLSISEVKAYNLKWWYLHYHKNPLQKRVDELEKEVARLKAQLADTKR